MSVTIKHNVHPSIIAQMNQAFAANALIELFTHPRDFKPANPLTLPKDISSESESMPSPVLTPSSVSSTQLVPVVDIEPLMSESTRSLPGASNTRRRKRSAGPTKPRKRSYVKKPRTANTVPLEPIPQVFPYCGNRECTYIIPVDVARNSSTPYCSPSCQTREQNIRQKRVVARRMNYNKAKAQIVSHPSVAALIKKNNRARTAYVADPGKMIAQMQRAYEKNDCIPAQVCPVSNI